MNDFEIKTTIGPGGALILDHLPFAPGQSVNVQVRASESASTRRPFVFGLHTGMIEISDDFDAPLPDSFWLGEAVDEVVA